ncbi:hypothetical protein BU23DRAFT_219034 [Bimuria novae-zelandiae CBS 107.79]|uniref:Uncharacterized protein n=1 Tax=Bimuria novae-zelandiae CBS 107.79 TaxID=1447943 RepID=A0A6A5UZY3_9PLEO|nr:hypothetical protein BU23DRAFT_219034 [Bimuria novae-zelandiae CBS 107.79]
MEDIMNSRVWYSAIMKKHNELKPPTPSEQFKNDWQEPSSTPKALRTCPKSLAITIPTGCDRIALPTFTKGQLCKSRPDPQAEECALPL